jgi:transcriptional regulator with XRE-family HTH domain
MERGRQTELARAMGVSPQTLANWLAGRKTPSLQKFLALQAFLERR